MLLNRRTLLTTMGAGILALAGCAVSNPTVSTPTGWTPSATPTPRRHPEVQAALDREIALRDRAATIQVNTQRSVVAASIASAHESHASALSLHFGPVSSPTPPMTSSETGTAAVAAWRTQLRTAGEAHRQDALQATGHLGLVLASCAAFAMVAADAVAEPSGEIGDAEAAEYVPVEDTTALSALVAQVHAARYAYQTALGAFQLSDDRRGPLAERVAALTHLRDVLTETLVARGVSAPAAEPAYDVVRPTSVEAAIALTAQVEERLLPFVGQAVAGLLADDDLRPSVIDQLIATTRRLTVTGGALPRWPGLVAY